MDINITNPVTVSKIGSVVNAAASATPNDTDLVMSVESSVAKKNTWTQVKAFLKTYFDTVYTTTSAVATQITTALSSYATQAYADAKVAQTITNGVTTSAPSQDVIFDALALKADLTDVRFQTDDILIRQGLGSTVKASTFDLNRLTSATNMTDGRLYFIPVYLRTAQTITGVKWFQGNQGNYTSDNYNGFGLYTYSGGTLTLVASSTDDGNIWKATANTYNAKAFSATYSASAGLYFIAALWNASATTTAPQLGSTTGLTNNSVTSVDFTNSAKYLSFVAGQTSLPATQAMSGTSEISNALFFLGLY